jgi:hypothetical protein
MSEKHTGAVSRIFQLVHRVTLILDIRRSVNRRLRRPRRTTQRYGEEEKASGEELENALGGGGSCRMREREM